MEGGDLEGYQVNPKLVVKNEAGVKQTSQDRDPLLIRIEMLQPYQDIPLHLYINVKTELPVLFLVSWQFLLPFKNLIMGFCNAYTL